MDRVFRTDEHEEAIASLEAVARFLDDVVTSIDSLRWVTIALHLATQGLMVLSLSHGTSLGVLAKSQQKKWLEAQNAGRLLPATEEWLAAFLDLYKRVKGQGDISHRRGPPFPATPEHDNALERLNDFRNQFVHFVPVGWAIPVRVFVAYYARVLDLVEFLIREGGAIRSGSEALERRCEMAVVAARSALDSIAERLASEDASEPF
jgi:hypothetical protein